jgi:hypothetical protein
VHESLGLQRDQAFGEKLLFDLATNVERHSGCGFHGINRGERGHQPAVFPAGIFASRSEDESVLLRLAKLIIAFACFWNRLCHDLAGKSQCAGQQIALDEFVKDA